MADRWVCLDVGETLIDETRTFSVWADALGVTRMSLMAAMGAAIVRGGDHRDAFAIVGRPDWRAHEPEVSKRYGGFQAGDLYPDALPTLSALHQAGFLTAIVANQPASRTDELRALGVSVDVMAMSDEFGHHKPSPEFFAHTLSLIQADPADIAYVGDRVDNDVLPSLAAGMRAIWLRRGPWGFIGSLPEGIDVPIIESLEELVPILEGSWR